MAESTERRQLRALVAKLLAEGTASREDIVADLLCASRSVRTAGRREIDDADELAHLWRSADQYADNSQAAAPG